MLGTEEEPAATGPREPSFTQISELNLYIYTNYFGCEGDLLDVTFIFSITSDSPVVFLALIYSKFFSFVLLL